MVIFPTFIISIYLHSEDGGAALVLRGRRRHEVRTVDLQDVQAPERVPANQVRTAKGQRGAFSVVAVEAGNLALCPQVHNNGAAAGNVCRPPRAHV